MRETCQIAEGSPEDATEVTTKSGSTSDWDSKSETESDNVENLSIEDDSRLTILHSKHLLIVCLMREFYAIFDQRWSVVLRGYANTAANRNAQYDIDASFPSSDSQGTRKRKINGRDTTPPEDYDDERRSRKKSSLATVNLDGLFACPLYQNNPIRYCASIIDGSKFRACAGPGFATISRLKYALS